MLRSFLFPLLCCFFFSFSSTAWAETTLKVYGPGGPAPAIKSAAAAYMQTHPDIKIEVTAGPAPQWMPSAQEHADLIFSGAEYMMNAFANQLPALNEASIYPLYLRPSTLLVRPGNPKQIKGFQDLLERPLRVLVVDGAGQVGLWEDMAAKSGDIEALRQLRPRIVQRAPNSGVAKQYWIEHPELDAWIIWNHWQAANPTLADAVAVEPEYRIYRSCAIATTQHSPPQAQDFYNYLKSPAAKPHFTQFGWF